MPASAASDSGGPHFLEERMQFSSKALMALEQIRNLCSLCPQRLDSDLEIVCPGLKSVRENCAAPLALDDSVPLFPPLPRWANESRRSAAG